jgi:HEAT repeat protein
MGVGHSLLKLTIGGGCVLGSLAFPPLLAGEGIVLGTVLATTLGSVAAGNTANAIDALIDGRGDEGVSLENQDLTKAVGKAIAAVITLAAKQQPRKTRQHLEKIAAQAKDNWVEIAQQELTQQRYPDLREAQLDQFLTPQEYKLTQQGNLTATEWGDIFIRLNMAACKGGGFPIPFDVRQQVAELLHTTFPKALRETFKEDFAKDGKAWAGLTLQLLTGMQAQLSQLQASQGGVDTEELDQILKQFQDLETQLRGSVTQQQKFFREVSRGIESGFAEVCQRLGVMETTITGLLQTLEERLKDLHQDVTKFRQEVREGLAAMQNQPRGRSLSPEEWQNVCRQMLERKMQLTSNTVVGQVYGNRNLINEDLFVDLALVKPKRTENPKHSQEIDPQKGSDLFTRQEETVEKQFAYQEFLQEIIGNRPEKKIAIIGEPGAGKTTLLQKLAFWLLEETDDLVVWVSLAELGSQPLHTYLAEDWLGKASTEVAQIRTDWQKKFEEGAVWLLLDGFDEMSQSDQAKLEIEGWVAKARIIVTCRLNLWQANPSQLQGFQTYLTQPFQDEQMQEFIRRWFRGLVEAGEDVKLAESLWSELQAAGKERIKDLCRNPLRLTLLCSTWKVDDTLPETTAELYEGFVESVYGWKETAFPVTEEQKERLNATLGELAKASLEAETSRFRLTHRLLCEHLGKPKAKGSLFPLALKLGWLNEVGVAAENPREKVYGFYHATFQEYFAALAVPDWDYFRPRNHVNSPVEGKRYRIFEPQWKQVILLWLGREDVGDEEKEAFIRGLVEFEGGVKDFYECQAYFLAVAAINEFKACSLAGEIVRRVVKLGFGSFHIEKQEWLPFFNPIEQAARKAIPETIRRLAITEVIDILDHCPDEKTRCRAASSLGEIGQGNPEAISALVKLIATTEDESTREQAAESLEEIDPGNPEAITALVKLIATTEDESTREQAEESLKKIDLGNPEAISALVKLIATTEDESTREQAAKSLGKIGQGNPEAIAGLVKIITTTQDESTRKQAASSLEKIDPGNPAVIAGLVKVVATTQNTWTQTLAAWSLEKIGQGNPEAIAGLVKIIATTESESTRTFAAKILGTIDPSNPEAIAGLVKVIATTEDKSTSRLAASSLEKIGQGNSEAISGLINVIATTKDESTREQAASSLEKMGQGNSEAIAGLINVIATTEDESTQMWAAWSLEKIDPDNPEASAGLLKVIANTQDELTQMFAALSLGTIDPDNPEAISVFLKVIANTQDEFTQMLAASSLGTIDPGNPEAIAGLVKLIATTEDESTREQAAESLGRIGQGRSEAITGLVKVIATIEDKSTRRLAASSLEKIGQNNSEAIAGLVKVLATTEDESTRRQAAESLWKIDPGNPEAIAGLVKLIATTEDESTRRRAASSLWKIDPGNPEAIAGLLKVITTTVDENTRRWATQSLGKILTTPQQYAGVVSALKDNLSDEVSQNNFEQFYQCYEVIWNCAENLPYPEFYQAWHHPRTTPHPEVEDNTPVASTPFTQQCNLALLPQVLNQANQSHPLNRQIVCIDGSRFSDPSNPALQIYTTLKKAGCPPINDKPRTIAELQAYGEDDLSDHAIALILYEEPTDPPPQGFDIAVLNQLARFSHPPIAVVLPERLTDCRLPQFLESDPNLVTTILQWLQNLER